jgi:hypothetical protein
MIRKKRDLAFALDFKRLQMIKYLSVVWTIALYQVEYNEQYMRIPATKREDIEAQSSHRRKRIKATKESINVHNNAS